jgi:Adaptor complexes medium subunit family
LAQSTFSLFSSVEYAATMNQNDAFDPFGLLESVTKVDQAGFQEASFESVDAFDGKAEENDDFGLSPPSPPPVSRVSRSSSKGIALPPKINVKLAVAEEVSSTANPEGEGSCNISVEGSIHAQVQCSDAMKNAPFCLIPQALQKDEGTVTFHPNLDFATDGNTVHDCLYRIPKHEIGLVPILRYSLNNKIQHMPLLLERKVTVGGLMCRIAIQVRSKLSNNGNLQNFTIAVAVPECVNGATMEIVRGEGDYDDLKRVIVWKLDELPKGESFMVSAQAKLWEPATDIQFPVLLRCMSAADQISDLDFKVTAAAGYPSSITFNRTCSFRLLHRLA